MPFTLEAFLAALFVVFILYALIEGMYLKPRRQEQRDAVQKALREFHVHMESFTAYVKEKRPSYFKLLLMQLVRLESQLMAEAKAGRPLIQFGKYDETYALYQEYLASRIESPLPKAA
jgi:hypothetical protein